MSHFNAHNLGIAVTPQLPPGSRVALNISPRPLQLAGFNMPVEIATASAFRQPPTPMPLASMIVMAHFDTGASITSIDANLAQHLQLNATGQSISHTAAGPQQMPNYAVDVSFPNTALHSFQNLQIGSCNLGFNIQVAKANPNNPRNFGLLIGRDMMARWNIVWNGPTSTVFLSD